MYSLNVTFIDVGVGETFPSTVFIYIFDDVMPSGVVRKTIYLKHISVL